MCASIDRPRRNVRGSLMGDKKRATSVGRSCGKGWLEGKMLGFRTHTDDIKLEERDDLLLYVK